MAVNRGYLEAGAAAVLFGLSTPLCTVLLGHLEPLLLAALLYLGAGGALALGRVFGASCEAKLGRADFVPLAGMVLAGGMVGPLLLLYGLRETGGLVGSLLLNLEMVFTALLAVAWFGEWVGRRGLVGLAIILAGAMLTGLQPAGASTLLGSVAIAGGCLAWAVDNNLSRHLSDKDPVAIVCAKGIGAGGLLLAIGLSRGVASPNLAACASALGVGVASYGSGLVLFVRAQRRIGAARTSGVFAAAPFVGALASVAILGERLTPVLGAGGLAMVLGILVLAAERHEHTHAHEILEHDHLHSGDDHHRHPHDGEEGPEPHSHPHRHEAIVHAHPHWPDPHHRHRH